MVVAALRRIRIPRTLRRSLPDNRRGIALSIGLTIRIAVILPVCLTLVGLLTAQDLDFAAGRADRRTAGRAVAARASAGVRLGHVRGGGISPVRPDDRRRRLLALASHGA